MQSISIDIIARGFITVTHLIKRAKRDATRLYLTHDRGIRIPLSRRKSAQQNKRSHSSPLSSLCSLRNALSLSTDESRQSTIRVSHYRHLLPGIEEGEHEFVDLLYVVSVVEGR